MNKQNKPETILIEDQNFGSHVEHWNLLTNDPTHDVPQWLGLALNAPYMPMGLCQSETEMDQDTWLIQGPKQAHVQLNQVIAVENQKPKTVKIAFPSFDSPYKYAAKIERIISCPTHTQAVLQLNLGAQNIVYAFDTLYSVNHLQYEKDQDYIVQLNAWAYSLEAVKEDDQIIVDDEASIKHHRALNDILAAHNGIAPDNLQDLIEAWQPQSEDDKAPVTINFSKMVAYLYGETLGQEDEAWFQGHVVGKTEMTFMDQHYVLYDVSLIHEEKQEAVLVRIATKENAYKDFNIGEFIRGNLWLQVSIHNKKV
jgi:hypothetical protein